MFNTKEVIHTQNCNINVIAMLLSQYWYFSRIDTSISDTFACSTLSKWYRQYFFTYFLQYSIPILLSSGALVNSINNNTTATEKVKTRTSSLK